MRKLSVTTLVLCTLLVVAGHTRANTGVAIWRSGTSTVPRFGAWNGTTFGTASGTADIGTLRIIVGAEAPFRNEKIVLGITTDNEIVGQIWDGASWNPLPFNPIDTVSESTWWGCAVAYEQISGDAVIVWNNNSTGIKRASYRVWDGISWSTADSIETSFSSEPTHMRLAEHPNLDELALIVSNSNCQDYAIIWDGSSWGNKRALDTFAAENDRTATSVAYEQQSGRALMLLGRTNSTAFYHFWNGSGWTTLNSIAPPAGITGNVKWTCLAADPNSDHIALGVVTDSQEVWLSVWNGTAWESPFTATDAASGSDFPAVTVAFESVSGNAIACYSEPEAVRYRKWLPGGGWQSELTVLDVGIQPNTVALEPSPLSNDMMLGIQNDLSDLYYSHWDGSGWGVTINLEAETNETQNQPFLYLWNKTSLQNQNPVLTNIGPRLTTELSELLFIVTAVDAESIPTLATSALPSGASFTDHSDGTGTFSWTPSLGQAGEYEITFYATDDSAAVDSEIVEITVAGYGYFARIETPDGQPIGDTVLSTDNDTTLLFCRLYALDSTLVGTIPASWTIIGDGIGTVTSDNTDSTIVTLTAVGTGYIIAVDTLGNTDTSGAISVIAGELDHLSIYPGTVDIPPGDSVEFSATGYDADNNETSPGSVTWDVLGRMGTIDESGMFIASRPGTGKVTALSSLSGIADTTGSVDVEALYLTPIPIGNTYIAPGQDTGTVLLAFRIENFFDDDKSVTEITILDAGRGAGSTTDRLTNVDTLSLYLDLDNDSILTPADSLIAGVPYDTTNLSLSFDPLTISPDSGRTLMTALKAGLYPRDGDTLDIRVTPADGITTGDGTIVLGPDTCNSFGFGLIDGMVADQIQITAGLARTCGSSETVHNILSLDIPRNGYTGDILTMLSVANNGTATDSDLDSLFLYRDNGDDVFTDSDDEDYIGRLYFTGGRWTVSGLTQPLTAQLTRFYVSAAIAPFPLNGATFELYVPIGGVEVASGNDGPTDTPTEIGDTVTVAVFESLQLIAASLPTHDIYPGASTGPILGFDCYNTRLDTLTLDSLTLTLYSEDPDGATQDQLDSQIDSIQMYFNRDANHSTLSAQDSLLASAPISEGTATIVSGGFQLPGHGVNRGLTFVAWLNPDNAKDKNTIALGIENAADIFVNNGAVVEGSFPLANDEPFTVSAFRASAADLQTLESQTIFGGETNRPVFDLTLPGNGYAEDELVAFRLTNSGTIRNAGAPITAGLWHDQDNNGFGGNDLLLGTTTAAGSTWLFDNLSSTVDHNGIRLIVTVSIENSAFDAGTIRLAIPIEGVAYASGTDGPDDITISGGVTHFVFPSNRITVISIPRASATVAPASSGITLMTFALYNGYTTQDHTLSGVSLTNTTRTRSTPPYADYELGQVSLYYDADHSRTYSENDVLAATGYFSAGTLRLSGLNITLLSEDLAYFFVQADLPRELIDSDSLSVSIEQNSDFTFATEVNINGDLPLSSGGYRIVDGSVSGQFSVFPLQSSSVGPGDTSVVLLAFQPARNGNQPDNITAISIDNFDDADNGDISSMELWLDTNSDSLWQSSDSLVGSLTFAAGSWVISSLDISFNSQPPILFIIADIDSLATPGAAFTAVIPVNGCQYASANDGPRDMPIVSNGTFTIFNSGLRARFEPLQGSFSVGQTVTVGLTVTNLLTTTITDAAAEIVDIINDSLLIVDSSNTGPIPLAAGESATFNFYFTAGQIGEVAWTARGIAPSLPDSSATVQTATVTLQSPPDDIKVSLINSIPTSVTRGQTNVFPMSVKIQHPADQTTASVKIDSLTITVENGSGSSIRADEVFTRMVLASGNTNLCILENPPSQSDVALPFTHSVILPPGDDVYLTLLVDIDSAAVHNDFALAITGTAVTVLDCNSHLPVNLDPSITFPLRTASCRIDNPSQQMLASTHPLFPTTVNRGQIGVDLLELHLRHPGPTGSSQIQLTELAMLFVDQLGDTLVAPDLVSRVSIMRGGSTIGAITTFAPQVKKFDIDLNSPVTLSPDGMDTISIRADIAPGSPIVSFGLMIPDSTDFDIRDLSSGSSLALATDTMYSLSTGSIFPIQTDLASLNNPASSPLCCPSSLLPASVSVGKDSLTILELSFDYQATPDQSPIKIAGVALTPLDSLGRPLDPDRVIDRTAYRLNAGSFTYLPDVTYSEGRLVYDLADAGIILNPGQIATVLLCADIEADIPYSNFSFSIENEYAVWTRDANDSTHTLNLIVEPACAEAIPFTTGVAGVYLAAGRPFITVHTPATRLSGPGTTDVDLITTDIRYTGLSLEGDLELNAVYTRLMVRTPNGLTPVNRDHVLASLSLAIGDSIVATDSVSTDENIEMLLPTPFVISRGDTIPLTVVCDIMPDAPTGNYVLEFPDSTCLAITDRNASTIIYPILSDASYPVYSADISLTPASLESSFTNYPNPFNPATGPTIIGYVLPEDARVDIEIFTITGDEVKRVVVNQFRGAGSHSEDTWRGETSGDIPVLSGTYFCRITARYISGETEVLLRKVAVIR